MNTLGMLCAHASSDNYTLSATGNEPKCPVHPPPQGPRRDGPGCMRGA